MPAYKIIEQNGAQNTAIAAAATEELASDPLQSPFFNYLIVQNFDTAVDSEILLDSGDQRTTAINQGKYYRVQFNGGNLIIEPEDGVRFKQLIQRNPHASTAQTANTITFQWGYKKRIG